MFSENMQDDIEKVLLSEEEIQEIVTRVGAEVSRDYRGKNLVLVSVLKGSVVFMADLMRAIDIPLSIDFMVVSSYGNGTESSGKVKIIKDLDLDLSGQDLLLVEDILDTGRTLYNLREILKMRSPSPPTMLVPGSRTNLSSATVSTIRKGTEICRTSEF